MADSQNDAVSSSVDHRITMSVTLLSTHYPA
jgi:5-enolpyruvylshikimate-3-phosphate synthase